MFKSRPARLAVSLCVTGALLLPLAGMSAGPRTHCANEVASTTTCPGCGSCSVAAGERCCCCQHAETATPRKSASAASGCCSDEHSAIADNASSTNLPEVCMCGGEDSVPAAPAPEGRTTVEQLIAKLLLTSPLVASSPRESTTPTSWEDSAPPALLPRDAQRRLCVWRI